MSSIYSILVAVSIGVIGQVVIKKGINLLGNIDFSKGFIAAYLRICLSPIVIAGSLIYLFSTFFWLYALSKTDLSFAYPFLALSYVLIVLASWLILGESISLFRWIGVLIICFGVVLVSRS
jgi:drug/metabolite transporter (DMT)-like permease